MKEHSSPGLTLADIGERRIVSKLLAPRYRDVNVTFGDDVADFGQCAGGVVVATTDPAPEPIVWRFAERDFFDWGWLLGALNLSDVAASGADPIGMLTSFTLPGSTLVADFSRLLDGVDAVCSQVGTHVRGGNIKEGPVGVCEGTALGLVEGRPLSRLGAAEGDGLFALGESGLFWAALLSLWDSPNGSGVPREELLRYISRPRPLIPVGRELRSTGIAKACMDASDGLYAAMAGLTVDQGLGFVFDCDEVQLSRDAASLARSLSVEPARLALGFGNLELVCAVSPKHEALLKQIAHRNGTHVWRLGEVVAGDAVLVRRSGLVGVMTNFDNERFSPGSQFTGGLELYRERLLEQPLMADKARNPGRT